MGDEARRAEAREDGRRLGESLAGDHSLEELRAKRRLGETTRDVERRLLRRRET